MSEKKFVGIVDFREICNSSNDVVLRDTILISVYAKNIDEAIEKIYDELLEIVKDDLKDVDTDNWSIGEIEDLEFGYSVDIYEKDSIDFEEVDCLFANECFHIHYLKYELVEVRDQNDNVLWSP